MADKKDLMVLKQKVDRLRSESDKAAGALEETMRKLKKDFGCKTLPDAKKLLRKLKEEEEALHAEFDEAHEQFEKEHRDVLTE